ncbi:hypothetical protein [Antrihabitans sp. YC2-6]|uniref:hypothetical protein n=1 Tax=Antrihabitans sp. YC2-6 TaxID=2799498 RepID=UPI0018F397EA|nr:hypothetical protein [Antrihabitans sp. YC2-6]MBJ8347439.1 hypothetical protein [Antrihabitans sp. YC2-6]
MAEERDDDDTYFDFHRAQGWVHRGPIGSEPGNAPERKPRNKRPLTDAEYEERRAQGWLQRP